MTLKSLLPKKIKWKVASILSSVVMLTIGLNSIFSLWLTNEGFEIYVSGENKQNAEAIAPLLEKYYSYHGSWDELSNLLNAQRDEYMNNVWESDVDWFEIVTQTIGIDTESLYALLDQKQGVAEIALSHGVEPEVVIRNIVEAEQVEIDQAVAMGLISEKAARQNIRLVRAFASTFVLYGDSEDSGELFSLVDTPDMVNLLLSTFYFEGQRLVVVSIGGFVVYDSLPDESKNILGSHLREQDLNIGISLYNQETNEQIGTVIVGSFSGIYDTQQEVFLGKINRSFLISGLVASIIGILIGFWLSQHFTEPIEALIEATRQLAKREALVKLPVKSDDELGQLTSTFNLMVDELNEQRLLRRRLLSDVSHELNTPLSIIQLETNGLINNLQTPAEAAYQIQQEVKHLKNIVNDLTWLSETDRGSIRFDFHSLDLVTEIRRLFEHYHPLALTQGVELSLNISSRLKEISSEVNADSFRLEQVFRNILDNALQHSHRGGEITISLRKQTGLCSPKNLACMIIEIHDTGDGIPEKDLPHIFERFYRIDFSRSRKNGGRGLGLAIVQSIIEGHGGRVWANSELNQGTTISYALPCKCVA